MYLVLNNLAIVMENLFIQYRTKLNIANLCNNIKPGDITHEDVCHSFNDYFRKFNRSLKFYVQQDGCDVLQQLPGFVLKVCRREIVLYIYNIYIYIYMYIYNNYRILYNIIYK